MNSKISNKDKEDWDNFISTNENLPDKEDNFISKKIDKITTFDLHGYSLDQANEKVKKLIVSAYDKGFYKIVIVTGKGIHSENKKDPYISEELGILKHSVPEYIKNNEELMSMVNEIKGAKVEDGGSGAFYIYIKKKVTK